MSPQVRLEQPHSNPCPNPQYSLLRHPSVLCQAPTASSAAPQDSAVLYSMPALPWGRQRGPSTPGFTQQAPCTEDSTLLPTLLLQHLYVISHSPPFDTIPRHQSTETSRIHQEPHSAAVVKQGLRGSPGDVPCFTLRGRKSSLSSPS